MIVFVEKKNVDKCFDENDGVFIAISCDLLHHADWMSDSSGLVPPPDVLAHYISTGSKSTLRTEYYQYLSDPRILMMLGLRIFQADKENVFMCFSKMEKETGYPKMLREFITDHLKIPKDFVVKYKDFDNEFHRMKPKTYNSFMQKMKDIQEKCNEALHVLD